MHNGTKVSTLTRAEKKKTADHSRLLYTRGFERDGESSTAREDESSLSLCSHEEPALAKCSGGGQ